MLDVLTIQFDLLSKPVDPKCVLPFSKNCSAKVVYSTVIFQVDDKQL